MEVHETDGTVRQCGHQQNLVELCSFLQFSIELTVATAATGTSVKPVCNVQNLQHLQHLLKGPHCTEPIQSVEFCKALYNAYSVLTALYRTVQMIIYML